MGSGVEIVQMNEPKNELDDVPKPSPQCPRPGCCRPAFRQVIGEYCCRGCEKYSICCKACNGRLATHAGVSDMNGDKGESHAVKLSREATHVADPMMQARLRKMTLRDVK